MRVVPPRRRYDSSTTRDELGLATARASRISTSVVIARSDSSAAPRSRSTSSADLMRAQRRVLARHVDELEMLRGRRIVLPRHADRSTSR